MSDTEKDGMEVLNQQLDVVQDMLNLIAKQTTEINELTMKLGSVVIDIDRRVKILELKYLEITC